MAIVNQVLVDFEVKDTLVNIEIQISNIGGRGGSGGAGFSSGDRGKIYREKKL